MRTGTFPNRTPKRCHFGVQASHRRTVALTIYNAEAMTDESSNGTEPADNLSPFEKFERLAKQIVSVPKADVDALRKKRQSRRRPTSPRS
ncbi:MAG: hypothetical protein ACYDBR_14395 [Gaiellaceae bacterium]